MKTDKDTRELNKEELEQVIGGAHQTSCYVDPYGYKAPNDTNQMPRGMQTSAVVEQYSPLP